jgi:hypothetical protein
MGAWDKPKTIAITSRGRFNFFPGDMRTDQLVTRTSWSVLGKDEDGELGPIGLYVPIDPDAQRWVESELARRGSMDTDLAVEECREWTHDPDISREQAMERVRARRLEESAMEYLQNADFPATEENVAAVMEYARANGVESLADGGLDMPELVDDAYDEEEI